jgi:2-keto-4-pentenoate hydratase/2-oxohepta-3-ene-1,7-dioic acid hydratase in catechol pathway
VIGARCAHVPPDEARAKIWGYTIANDITARDLQKRDGQWTRAKGFDTFCPLGPWIVRELSPGARFRPFSTIKRARTVGLSRRHDLQPRLFGSLYQRNYDLAARRRDLDGHPSGVGPLSVGDQVRVEIEGIGGLNNTVALRPQG